jgi:hypothetical protein
MKKINKILLPLFFLGSIASSSLTLAQESDTTDILIQNSDTTYLPSRGKHVFTSISGVDDPFVSTKFLLGVGVAEMLETTIPITIGGVSKTIEFQPNVIYTTGGFEFQYAIRNWAAIQIQGFGMARLGNNFLSLASEGVSAGSTLRIGWLFRIVESKDIMFSGTIALNTSDLTFIDLLAETDTTITQIDTTINRQMINNYQSLTTKADLRFAARFSDVFGMLAKLEGGFGEVYAAESESQYQYNFGLAFSIDLRNWIGIPFGIGLGGSILSNELRFDDAKPPIYSTNLTIAFYNRNDFTIGVENYLQIIEPQQYEQTFNFLYSRVYMCYYF